MKHALSPLLLLATSLFIPHQVEAKEPGGQAPRPVHLVHDPSNPPIDCPLRRQGLNPDKMRPFKEIKEYIALLERPDRAAWQRPDEVITALKLQGTEQVIDLGAGSGYFAFRFAKALPKGRVIAADVEPEMLRYLHHKAMTEGLKNVEVKLIQPDDPGVPKGIDLIFVCNVLHHVADRPAWLDKISAVMKPGAQLLIIEFKEGELPKGPPASLKIPHDTLIELVTQAGLQLKAERADLLPYQSFLLFQKPGAQAPNLKIQGEK